MRTLVFGLFFAVLLKEGTCWLVDSLKDEGEKIAHNMLKEVRGSMDVIEAAAEKASSLRLLTQVAPAGLIQRYDPCSNMSTALTAAEGITSSAMAFMEKAGSDIGTTLDDLLNCSGLKALICFGENVNKLIHQINQYKPTALDYGHKLKQVLFYLEAQALQCFGISL